jgi:isopenicillin-N epimerase
VDPVLLEAFGLDPDVLHLNHGAFGVAPVVVRRAAAAWRERAERNPHRFNRVEIGGLVAAARERAAGFLGVDPSRAAWVRNVSEGVSAVLGSLDLRPGDELVISTHGYGAVRKALSHHAARAGARIVEAAYPVGAGDDVIVSAYAAACSRRTRLAVIDRITSPTATVVPVAAVAAAVGGIGTSVLVDAAHAPGQLPDDIPAFGADYWIGNLHKWAYTPRGSAIMWSRPGADVMPTVLSWQLEDGYAASFDYPGTWDYAGWLAAADGLAYWEALGGWDAVARLADLVADGQRRWPKRWGSRSSRFRSHLRLPCGWCRCQATSSPLPSGSTPSMRPYRSSVSRSRRFTSMELATCASRRHRTTPQTTMTSWPGPSGNYSAGMPFNGRNVVCRRLSRRKQYPARASARAR